MDGPPNPILPELTLQQQHLQQQQQKIMGKEVHLYEQTGR